MASKSDLLSFLDRHVFHPILNASEAKYSANQREDLAEVKKKTEAERTRFHRYDSAERVISMYKDDLTSTKAKPVNAHLQDLGLPCLADVRQEFLKLAGEKV